MAIRQSLAWWCFNRNGMTPERFFSAAARIGYQGVELLDEALWPLAREHGLAVSAIGGHKSIASGLNRRENHDRIEREINAALEKATRWSIPNVLVFSGNRDGLDDQAGAEITVEGLRRVAPAAESAGVTLVLELLNSKVNHADYQADRTAWGVNVCQSVGSPRVKLLFDVYHVQIMEGDIIATLRSHIKHIGHVHTGGVPGRAEIDETQELNYSAITLALTGAGYEGYLAHEFIPRRDPIEAITYAFNLCNVEINAPLT